MCAVLVIAGLKGGVGKTTTSISLASEFAVRGADVVLVDLDPQASATLALGRRPASVPPRPEALPIDLPEAAGTLALTPGGRGWAHARSHLVDDHLREAKIGPDLMVVDTPPVHSTLTMAALGAADVVLSPVECGPLSLPSLRDLEGLIAAQPNPPILRALLVRIQSRRLLTGEVVELIEREYPGLLVGSGIPEDVRAAEAPGHGIPLCTYARRSRAAEAYRSCAELLLRELWNRPIRP